VGTSSTKPGKVLIIGSGPIVIGQAAEFDYAGTQACKAMREEGVVSVLVNSNPATIMTDQEIADIVYIEPLTVEVLERIIARERPDGILPTLGGQTGLNLAVQLAEAGILERYGVRLLGTPLEAIRRAEDRELFRELMRCIGEPIPESIPATTVEQAEQFAREIGFPLIIRPAYTLGGTGGGVAYGWHDLREVVQRGLLASPIGQVLVERSLLGWKEIEYEVMRDAADNCITVCNMENIDPMGVHTGDSIVVAPSQTLSDREYQMLRSAALKIIRALGIEGGCNIQFALDPHSFQYYVIEVNPRVSRSSALASKATGYPIARVAAKIAIGKTLDQIPNAVTKKTTAAFEPALDYVVVKLPRWPFDKFPYGDRTIGTQMKATGEVMAIDRSLEAALQKAVRSLEVGGKSLLWEDEQWSERETGSRAATLEKLFEMIARPNDLRLWAIMAALRRDVPVEKIHQLSKIDVFFLNKFRHIVEMERQLLREQLTPSLLFQAKRMGFSDDQIAELTGQASADKIRELRAQWGIRPVYKMVDTCAAEFAAETPYFYSTYEVENEAEPLGEPAALVVGSGPIRIGQGIEFDYSSVHAAWALQQNGRRAIMVNSNPETVSTDFDTSDRLYFEPLDAESVLNILENEAGAYEHEAENANVIRRAPCDLASAPPVVVQFGGQTAINLAEALERAGAQILGSSAKAIDIAEDREKFEDYLDSLGIPQPPGGAVTSIEDALAVAQQIGYPVLCRPSYVLGGRAMEIIHNPKDLRRYVATALALDTRAPVLIDKYLEGKEVEVDAISDGEDTLIPGIMEHIERAGVHSGDSFAVYPPINVVPAAIDQIVDFTSRICRGLEIKGLVNIQYVIYNDEVYVLEVNPRASRTVPFLSKVTGVPMVRLATEIMLGRRLRELGYGTGLWPARQLVAVKAPVFSMSKLGGVDTYLGPEMKSTGEVMGVDTSFVPAMYKAMVAAGLGLPPSGEILISIADRDKPDAVPIIQQFAALGYTFCATSGTAALIRSLGLAVRVARKLRGRRAEEELQRLNPDLTPTVVDVIRRREVVAVINTMTGAEIPLRDGFEIRRAAVELRIPCLTSLDTARALAGALAAGDGSYNVRPLDEYVGPLLTVTGVDVS
jgi:carbamoyl-phosphate synthase large subunit